MKCPPFKRTPLTAEIGEAVQAFRKVAGMSQEKLESRSGLALIIVKAIEEGEYRLTLGDLEALAKALKVEEYVLVALADTFQRIKEVPPIYGD
jgi:transcriptional regulator with XRE-family HTH domain